MEGRGDIGGTMRRLQQHIVIGKIVSAFGIKGEVKILVLTDFPERFEKGREIGLKCQNQVKPLKIESSRFHKGMLLAKLQGVVDRNQAEELRGCEIVVEESELKQLKGDEFYVFDLIGVNVATEDGRDLGAITEVLQGGANDVYVTDAGFCIPALRQVVIDIDLEKAKMVIRPLPGMLSE